MHYPANNHMSALVGQFKMEAHCQYCNRFKAIYPETVLRRYGDMDIATLNHRLSCSRCRGRRTSIMLSPVTPVPDNVVVFPDVDNDAPI